MPFPKIAAKEITLRAAVGRIRRTAGRIFSVLFVKRMTGEMREMTCRIGVTCRLKGGKATYDAASKGLIRVFDVQVEGYRCINIAGLRRLNIDGQFFAVKGVKP